MTISACYITKNGEDFLEKSIQSVKNYVDEIIVIDNKSTDRTLEIADKYADILVTKHFDNKKDQRNEYLEVATSDWILVIDDDEIYKKDDIRRLKQLIDSRGNELVFIHYPSIHFWKSPDKVITGHMWQQHQPRCFKNINGVQYVIHHKISDKTGRFLDNIYYSGQMCDFDINIYHYSYLKPKEKIRKKIRYYMLRDNPNATEDSVEEWVDKHPFFSSDYNQSRFGENGLYVAGSWGRLKEKVEYFDGEHPEIMSFDISFYRDYIDNANKYMENHWRYHNHLDHKRHQNRLKYTAEFCMDKTLEVGCANGFSTDTMARHNRDATFSGLEVTDWGYRQACKNYPYDFYKGLGENMPFKDGEFDTVLLAEIIEHCQYPRKLVDEGWRVAKERLIITTPTKEHPDPDHKRFYTISEMKDFLKVYLEQHQDVHFAGLNQHGQIEKNTADMYFQIAIIDK